MPTPHKQPHTGIETVRTVILDDNDHTRRHLAQLLTKTRLVKIEIVGEANDNVSAIAVIERTQPDLVLLDMHMPDTPKFPTGISILMWIRQTYPSMQIIALTLFDDATFGRKCIELGAYGCIDKTKGFKPLISLIDKIP